MSELHVYHNPRVVSMDEKQHDCFNCIFFQLKESAFYGKCSREEGVAKIVAPFDTCEQFENAKYRQSE